MAGTSEARKIIEHLSRVEGVKLLATATTRHGAELALNSGAHEILEGRFDSVKLAEIIKENEIELLIDATHPFASEATRNAIIASETSGAEYMRFERPPSELPDSELLFRCSSFEDAVWQIRQIRKKFNNTKNTGRIFHLAGVNTLHHLTDALDPELIVVRVLPSVYSLKKCLKLGIPPFNIVAMEGVFSKKFNRLLMENYQISVVLTKESGDIGGTPSKIQAAIDLNIPVVVVSRPEVVELKEKKIFNNLDVMIDGISKKQ